MKTFGFHLLAGFLLVKNIDNIIEMEVIKKLVMDKLIASNQII